MMDRKAFQISGLIFLAMIAATLWRLSLFPDWQTQRLFLFAPAASLLLSLIVPFINWLASSEETLPAWRRWSGKWIVSWAVFNALMQAFVLARSLNLVSPSGMDTARFMLVLIGIILMMTGNAVPKTPLPSQSSPFEFNLWQKNRMLRFGGKLLVGVGLTFAVGGLVLPLELWQPVFGCLMFGALAAGIGYGFKLRRETSVS